MPTTAIYDGNTFRLTPWRITQLVGTGQLCTQQHKMGLTNTIQNVKSKGVHCNPTHMPTTQYRLGKNTIKRIYLKLSRLTAYGVGEEWNGHERLK